VAYSKLSSKFPFVLLNPQREVMTVPANDRASAVYATVRLSTMASNDRTATVTGTSRLAVVPTQSRTAVAQPE
jgi:hypothetical protein